MARIPWEQPAMCLAVRAAVGEYWRVQLFKQEGLPVLRRYDLSSANGAQGQNLHIP